MLLLALFVGLVLLVGRVILFLLQPACLSTVPPTTSTSAAAAALRVPSRPWASTRESHPHPPLQQKSSTRAAHQRRCRTTHPTPSPPTAGGNASLQRPGIRSQASCHPDPPLQPARTQTTPLPTDQHLACPRAWPKPLSGAIQQQQQSRCRLPQHAAPATQTRPPTLVPRRLCPTRRALPRFH